MRRGYVRNQRRTRPLNDKLVFLLAALRWMLKVRRCPLFKMLEQPAVISKPHGKTTDRLRMAHLVLCLQPPMNFSFPLNKGCLLELWHLELDKKKPRNTLSDKIEQAREAKKGDWTETHYCWKRLHSLTICQCGTFKNIISLKKYFNITWCCRPAGLAGQHIVVTHG